MLEFGLSAYEAARTLPPAFLPVAVDMERRRRALHRLEQFDDLSITDSVDQGREYHDPDNPPKAGGAHYDLSRYQRQRDALLAAAYPDQFGDIARQRRDAQIEAKWNALDVMMGGGMSA